MDHFGRYYRNIVWRAEGVVKAEMTKNGHFLTVHSQTGIFMNAYARIMAQESRRKLFFWDRRRQIGTLTLGAQPSISISNASSYDWKQSSVSFDWIE